MKVIINEGGLTCTTVNPFDDLMPVHGPGGPSKFFLDQFQKWRELRDQAEIERQTFEIDYRSSFEWKCNCGCVCGKNLGTCFRCGGPRPEKIQFVHVEPGTTHEAEIVNGKAVIK